MKNTNCTYLDMKMSLPKIDFDSRLASLIIDLEKLRNRKEAVSAPFAIYDELRMIFQKLESLGSARIEGNRTTISELTEKIIENTDPESDESLMEVLNIDKAINFLKNIINENTIISKAIICETHKILVRDLKREGSKTPGEFRKVNPRITGSDVLLPDFTQIDDYLDFLLDFIKEDHDSKYDLLKIALAHHRFVYIHPFDNGNGRTVRLLTYMMLIKYGFNINYGDIINPTAIFCNDRQKYYDSLERADSGNEEDIIEWCCYVLEGLKNEMLKIDKLSNINYVRETILSPALKLSLERQYITDLEFKVLDYVINTDEMVFKSGDIESVVADLDERKRKTFIKQLKENKIIKPINGEKSRNYTVSLSNSILLRSIIKIMSDEGFIPDSLIK